MRAVAGALAAAVSMLLAGCAQPDDGAPAVDHRRLQRPEVLSVGQGLPAGMRAARGQTRPVAAILGPGRLALVTWGSSSCPWTPKHVQATGPDALRVRLHLPGSKRMVCTADLGPTTVRLGVDPAMTRAGAVRLVLEFPDKRKDVRLAARRLRVEG
jgi:hypothetical protein